MFTVNTHLKLYLYQKKIVRFILIIFSFSLLSSCSFKKNLVYINDVENNAASIINTKFSKNLIEVGDVLKIDIQSMVPETAIPYNKIPVSKNNNPNIQLLQLEGYLVDKNLTIKLPVLGHISVENTTVFELENKITELLSEDNHLINPTVNIRRINSKFTVLGEVRNPGTYSYFDENMNFFQALGYAGDLKIEGKRNDITLIREINGLRKVYMIEINKSDILQQPYYEIKNNDVIIVHPNFSQVKSAGFIGSASSIASISSLLLSITLLILNR